MAIVEFIGGQINHRYLMRKTKDDLAHIYEDNRQHFNGGGDLSRNELLELPKSRIADHVMTQFRRIWKEHGE